MKIQHHFSVILHDFWSHLTLLKLLPFQRNLRLFSLIPCCHGFQPHSVSFFLVSFVGYLFSWSSYVSFIVLSWYSYLQRPWITSCFMLRTFNQLTCFAQAITESMFQSTESKWLQVSFAPEFPLSTLHQCIQHDIKVCSSIFV